MRTKVWQAVLIAFLIPVVSALSIVSAAYAVQAHYRNSVVPGVRVAGVDLTGLDRQAALDQLHRDLTQSFPEEHLVFECSQGYVWRAIREPDFEAAVDRAMQVGKRVRNLADLRLFFEVVWRGVDLDIDTRFGQYALQGFPGTDTGTAHLPTEGSLAVGGTEPVGAKPEENHRRWLQLWPIVHLPKVLVEADGNETAGDSGTNRETRAAPPPIDTARLMVPLRLVAEALDEEVFHDSQTRTFNLGSEGAKLVVGLGFSNAVVRGKVVPLDLPAEEVDGEVLVPLRLIEEGLETNVRWCPDEQRITITRSEGKPKDKPGPFRRSALTSVTISAAGDTTLGRDYRQGYAYSLDHEFDRQGGDYGYFFRNVRPVFAKSDLSMVNLEGPLTNATKHTEKEFVFRGPPEYARILKEGGINVVNLANNHTRDYLEQGYRDTKRALAEVGIGYFGFDESYVTTVGGIRVGLLGYTGWTADPWQKELIRRGIKELKDQDVDLIIVNMHWGEEGSYQPNRVQRELGRFIVDAGADLVLGHHPHVIQEIEQYRGRHIVYSLANFVYGGHRNPPDKDTFIFQQTFVFWEGRPLGSVVDIIPCSVSSVPHRNDFQPTPLTGEDAARVLERLRYQPM